MEVFEEKKGHATIFSLKGRLDSSSSPSVEETILQSIEQGNKELVLDFSSLDYISSAGIRVLFHCYKKIEKKQGHFFLASVPKSIENILHITGVLPYFKVFEKKTEAIRALPKLKN